RPARRARARLDDPPHAADPADDGGDRPLLHRDPRRHGRRAARPPDPLPDVAAAIGGTRAPSQTPVRLTRRPRDVHARSKPTVMPSRRPSMRGIGPTICTNCPLNWYSRPLATLVSVPVSLP